MIKKKIEKFIRLKGELGEWLCRILISLNIVLPGLNNSGRVYPIDVLFLLLVSYWLYVYQMKGLSLLILIVSFYFNVTHIGLPYED
jgi:hypothetical protein